MLSQHQQVRQEVAALGGECEAKAQEQAEGRMPLSSWLAAGGQLDRTRVLAPVVPDPVVGAVVVSTARPEASDSRAAEKVPTCQQPRQRSSQRHNRLRAVLLDCGSNMRPNSSESGQQQGQGSTLVVLALEGRAKLVSDAHAADL